MIVDSCIFTATNWNRDFTLFEGTLDHFFLLACAKAVLTHSAINIYLEEADELLLM